MPKTFSVAFSIGAALGTTFQTTMTRAGGQLGKLSGRISSLQKTQAAAGKFETLQKGLSKTSQDLVAARERFRQIQEEMKNTSRPTRAMTNRMAAAGRAVHRLETRLQSERVQLGTLRKSLGEAGVSTRSLAADQEKLAAKIEKARAAQAKLGKALGARREIDNQKSSIGSAMIGMAAPALAVAAPFQVAAGFEQAMAEVKAVSGATGQDLEALTATAKHLGSTTSFSAREAAAGMKYLAMAGFKTNETVAAMPGVLDLARAGSTDLAEASDIASDMLSAFRLEASDMGMLGDVLAKTFTTSNTTLVQLGEAMKFVAPAAASAGVSLQETAAMAGLLGDVGIKGSMAGTALRAAVLRLSAPPKMAAKSLSELNVATKDAEGNLRSVPEIFADIAHAMDGMGSGDRLEHIKKIFGVEASSAMAELMDKTSSGEIIQKIRLVTDSKGASREIAKEMENTTMGTMRAFSSALEGLQISAATLFLPAVKGAAQWLTSVTAATTALTEKFPVATKIVGGLAAGFVAARVAVLGMKFVAMSLRGFWLDIKIAYGWIKALEFQTIRATIAEKIRAVVTKVSAAAQWTWNAALAAPAFVLAKARVVGLAVAQKAGVAATGLMTAAQWALNVALNANPIGLVVAGVGALAAGAYLVYKKWEPIKAFFAQLWEKIKGMFEAAGKLFKKIPGLGGLFGDEKEEKSGPGLFKGMLGSAGEKIKSMGGLFKGLFKGDKGEGAAQPETVGPQSPKGDLSESVSTLNKTLATKKGPGRGPVTVNVSSTINIAAGTDAGEVKTAVTRGMAPAVDGFKDALEGMMAQERRLAYE